MVGTPAQDLSLLTAASAQETSSPPHTPALGTHGEGDRPHRGQSSHRAGGGGGHPRHCSGKVHNKTHPVTQTFLSIGSQLGGGGEGVGGAKGPTGASRGPALSRGAGTWGARALNDSQAPSARVIVCGQMAGALYRLPSVGPHVWG